MYPIPDIVMLLRNYRGHHSICADLAIDMSLSLLASSIPLNAARVRVVDRFPARLCVLPVFPILRGLYRYLYTTEDARNTP